MLRVKKFSTSKVQIFIWQFLKKFRKKSLPSIMLISLHYSHRSIAPDVPDTYPSRCDEPKALSRCFGRFTCFLKKFSHSNGSYGIVRDRKTSIANWRRWYWFERIELTSRTKTFHFYVYEKVICTIYYVYRIFCMWE